jgi:hypothetical protein
MIWRKSLISLFVLYLWLRDTLLSKMYKIVFSDFMSYACKHIVKAVPWLRRLVAILSPRRSGFDPGVNPCGVFFPPRVLRFSRDNFISPVLHYTEKWKRKTNIFITELHNKPQGCGASVASAVGPFTTKTYIVNNKYIYPANSSHFKTTYQHQEYTSVKS